MKKYKLQVAALLMAGCIITSSCIGSFGLFNKYANWQKEMTNSKFVNAIVGFILMPIVGSITLFVDLVVLNTIEFWSGENPVAENIGKTKMVTGKDGLLYAVKTLRDGYEITAPNGEVTLLSYDKANDSWSVSQNGNVQELFRFNKDGKSIKAKVNGAIRDISLNQEGLDQVKWATSTGVFLASN